MDKRDSKYLEIIFIKEARILDLEASVADAQDLYVLRSEQLEDANGRISDLEVELAEAMAERDKVYCDFADKLTKAEEVLKIYADTESWEVDGDGLLVTMRYEDNGPERAQNYFKQ